MARLRRSLHRCLLAGALVGAAGACRDAPTVPDALSQLAGGEGWVAVGAPAGLPSLATWLPYLDRSSPQGEDAARRIPLLTQQARRARAEGQLRLAAALDREAARVAVLALGRAPDAPVLRGGLAALDFWTDRVRSHPGLPTAPELAASLAAVEEGSAGAARALQGGDTTTAVLLLAEASERVRAHTPDAVALRVLAQVEARLSGAEDRSPALDRALHLVRSAREELVAGSPTRALHRALYALQLAEGREFRAVPRPASGPPCGGACDGL